jgi:hypothetical protein
MKTNKYLLLSAMLAIAVMAVATSAWAQQINGTPGSVNATVTLDGKQLPPLPLPFGGVIKESVKDSKPYWPPSVVPRKGAPNILLIMTDDQGYGISSTFGGVIPTSSMDRIAKAGLRYTQFHSTALCSPTRAALITGRNHHSVGSGVVGRARIGRRDVALQCCRGCPSGGGKLRLRSARNRAVARHHSPRGHGHLVLRISAAWSHERRVVGLTSNSRISVCSAD